VKFIYAESVMKNMGTTINKFIYWTPRALSIIFICFLALFSLDVFEENLGFWGTILGLFMHNIPVFILAVVLWVSWRREIVGGIVFTLAGIFYVAMITREVLRNPSQSYMMSWNLIVAGPAILIGILFIINWFKKRNSQ